MQLSMALLQEEEDDGGDDGQEVEAAEDHSDHEPAVTDVVHQGHALLQVQGLGRDCHRGAARGHVGPELGKLQRVIYHVEDV